MFMLSAATLYAHLQEYNPFTPKDKPGKFPVRQLVEWRLGNPDGNLYLSQTNRRTDSKDSIVRVSWRKQGDGVNVTMLSSDMKPKSDPVHVSSATIAPYGVSADLNGDAVLDYILFCPYGNNDVGDVVFVLSEGPRYAFAMVSSLYAGLDDFLDIAGDGRFHFLHSTLAGDRQVRGKDGLAHNYWVYNLLIIDGSTVKVDLSSAGFPKWIFYTFRPNHEETDQLTLDQKRQLFDPERVCIISTSDRPCPGYFQ
jgi:hypothetical protein